MAGGRESSLADISIAIPLPNGLALGNALAPRRHIAGASRAEDTTELKNPFRVNDRGRYDQRYTDALSAKEGGTKAVNGS